MKLSHWEPDLRTLVNWIDSGEIDLQPNFQRGDVWPISKKRKLIDTILREWSIPPIHVVVTSTGTLEVLDGQQRLTAIRDFMKNEFAIDGKIEPHDPKIETLGGYHYADLPPTSRRAFDQYTLRVFRITEYEPEEPGELFYRLNQQITLTAGEQRNAIFGPAREQLKQLVMLFENLDNKRENVGFSNARLAYDDVFAKLLFFIECGSFAEKATESRISDRFKLQKPFSNEIFNRSKHALELFDVARVKAKRLKLNKATLLSWLLFYSRFHSVRPRDEYLGFFEAMKNTSYNAAIEIAANWRNLTTFRNTFQQNLLSLFIDRSSLRVSDVSSVVYRDFAIWGIYKLNDFGPIPSSVDVEQITQVEDLLEERDDVALELALESALEIRKWARL